MLFISVLLTLVTPALDASETKEIAPVGVAEAFYNTIDFGDFPRPDPELFERAFAGYQMLLDSGKLANSATLSMADFRIPSNEKRFWVIDLNHRKVLHHTLIAHGKNSGDLYARVFSNRINSLQSSLGFYVTGSTYNGKHGMSLLLHGVEKDVNDRAQERAIVVHGASYVSARYAEQFGRIGRSFGCPALPMESHKAIIETIKSGSCLFIFYPDADYLANSRYQPADLIVSQKGQAGSGS